MGSRLHQNNVASLRLEKEVTIQNRDGLHARPAALLVKLARRHHVDLWVERDGERVNGKSIMGLMMLAASKGTKLKLLAEGAGSEKAISEIQELIDSRFGEE
ncbi:MAG: HPr family phosphocarrier protein [Candidatus Xiphinematobacter sp.]|nr:MAG: HPr family phosphocarrier protein [Candidatus Xiphinematobacter sp.]QQY09688.1 MAG: HPr family phosphocarrier protein [Candidatus Xiphinematobacter sp.]QQY09696.1 MAG: HPr family phosphocarrier protein [Candidatus Xiphinematobacter sp.]QQY11174.1 MAG: HPr family phosphocarrier protein [Candidatus Xiphinematobacter sp.]